MVRELKHTEIGDIPVDWELQTFDETFRVISNNTLSRENLNNRGGAVRNIHYGDILTKFPEVLDCNEEEIPYVNELSLLSSSTQLLQDGDIVVADTAEDETVGKVIEVQNLGDSKLVAGLHTIPCRVKKGEFAPGWLGYYMNSDLFHNQILPYITGIKVSSISKGAISETLILVPPFDEQKKIVQSLNKIQLLMTAETKVVNKIKLVKNGCLSKMFPQKDDTVPEMRLPGFTEAWERRKLLDCIQKITDFRGRTPKKLGMDWSEEGYLALSAFNVKNGYIDFNQDVHYGNQELYDKWMTGNELHKGQVLFTTEAPMGNVAQVPDNRHYILSQRTIAFDVKDKLITENFLATVLRTPTVFADLTALSSGGTAKGVSQKSLASVEIRLPKDLNEQEKIADTFFNLDHLITLHQCKCDKYSNIKKGMMSDLLTGKIRLV